MSPERATGTTTRLILEAANLLSAGKRVLIVACNRGMANYIRDSIAQVLVTLTNDDSVSVIAQTVSFDQSGGHAFLVTPENIKFLRGIYFDLYLADGELNTAEKELLDYAIRSVNPPMEILTTTGAKNARRTYTSR